jgi:hypothetical protein
MSEIIDFIIKDWKKYLGKSPEQKLFEAEQNGIQEEERSQEDTGDDEYERNKK